MLCALAMGLGLSASAQSRNETVFDAWNAVCQQMDSESEPFCFFGHVIANEEGDPISEVRILQLKSEEGETVHRLQIRTPLGVLLPAATSLIVDEEAILDASYVVCLDVCIAETEIDRAVLDLIADGFVMQIVWRHVEAPDAIVLPVNLAGFSDARAHISE